MNSCIVILTFVVLDPTCQSQQLTGAESGINHGNQASAVEINELDLFVAIGKTARMARFVHSSTAVKISSKVNWYFFEYIRFHVVARALSLVRPPWSPACRDPRRDTPPRRPAADVIVGQLTPAVANYDALHGKVKWKRFVLGLFGRSYLDAAEWRAPKAATTI
jgi:hypothetical protein